MNDFAIHACEQVLRFTTVETWDELPDKIKTQLAFNMGVFALGLRVSKEDGYQMPQNAREGIIPMSEFHDHLRSIINTHKVSIKEENITKQFNTWPNHHVQQGPWSKYLEVDGHFDL